MRALAVIAVILAHAGASIAEGGFVGVDLFFVLSGYLITELLIREWHRAGRISLRQFWARRARRLLPASTLVLVVTAVAAAVLPAAQRRPVMTDIIWSALFAGNWRFAREGTDYFARDRAVSPVQHYWSLGVEEQFYVLWPLLVVACGLVAARIARRGGIRWTVGILAVAVIVVSCLYSVQLTETNQPYAYFGTPSRAWQLGLGALLACISPAVQRLGPRPRLVLAAGGLTAFLWAVLTLSETGSSAAYPGTAALVPTIGAACMVAAGDGGTTVLGRAPSPGAPCS